MNKFVFGSKLFCVLAVIIALSGCSDNGQANSDLPTISSETNLQETAITTEFLPAQTTQSPTQTTSMPIVTTTVQTETTTDSQKSTNTSVQTQQDTSSLTSLTTTSEVTAIQTTQSPTQTTSILIVTTTENTDVFTSDADIPIEYPDLTPLTDDESLKLKEDFAKYKSSVWTNTTSDEMTVINYYGTYNGNEVVVMYGIEYTMTDDEKYVNVGGYIFSLPSGSLEILLHIDNDFIDIQTAYATGYLSDEDVAAIYYYSTRN